MQGALDSIPAPQRPVILVVGYADKAGRYLHNVDLGLRRAQVVVEFLQQHHFTREYEGRAVSGGIDNSPGGRRVSIYVTGTQV